MPKADPPKEVNTIKKNNGRLLLQFSSKMTHYFKEFRTLSGVLKKLIVITKLDDANRSSIPKI